MLNDNSISFDGNIIKQSSAVMLSWEEFVNVFIDDPKMARRDKIFKQYIIKQHNRYIVELSTVRQQ
jgi:hypothetical protein